MGQYVRLPNGVWCVTDFSGRRYPVDYYGGRWTKQRLRMPVATEHRRPAEVPTAIWRQMSAQEHRDWWANNAKPSDASPVALPAPCAVARPDSKSGS
eukprot:1703671-Alexandrium_andersonii.AAC.1